jgi:two-component system response regulator ChvI
MTCADDGTEIREEPELEPISGFSESGGLRVVLVDDDPLFREALSNNLADEGISTRGFADGRDLLRFVDRHGADSFDAVLLDLKMPGMDGIAVLRALRAAGHARPAIFLTGYSDEAYEQAALEGGAVDFVDKTRSVSILAARLRIVAQGGKSASEDVREPLRIGALCLNAQTARAFWRDRPVTLTVTQFRIVHLLATRAGEDVSYREIYDTVHGPGFAAGEGEYGYRVNVRSLIKRIRRAFLEVDAGFEEIGNYPAFGYRWRRPAAAAPVTG